MLKRAFRNSVTSIISLAMLFSLSTGCSNQKKETKAPETKAAATTGSQTSKIAEKETTLKVMRYEHASQTISADAPAYKEIFNKTNIKINFESIPLANYEDKKKILIATNSLPDIIQVNRQNLNDNGKSGIFLPLLENIKKYAPNFSKVIEKYPDVKKLVVNNELYAFPQMKRSGDPGTWGPVIRTDLLKKHNLKVPDSFDELYTVLKKLKEIYPDSYPMTPRVGTKFLIANISYPMGSGFALSNNTGTHFGLYLDKDKGNKYIYAPVTPEFKEVITYLNKLFKEGLLDPDYATNTQQQWTEKITSSKSFFFYDTATYAVTFGDVLKKTNPEAELSLIPIMKNSKGIRRNFLFPIHSWDDLFAISSKVKQPEVAVKFMDWLYSEEGADITNYGILNEHYTKNGSDYKVDNNLMQKYKTAANPQAALQAALGTGMFQMAMYMDDGPSNQMDPSKVAIGKTISADPGNVENILDPPFTDDENSKIKAIRNKLENYFNTEIDKFIMGSKPMSEYDAFASKLKELGSAELESIYNSATDRFNKSVK